MGALVGIKIQSPTLFSWKSTQQACHIRSHFGVKTKLIWKRKYRQGAELATSGNSGKCNWVRIISLITSDQINNNARWETTVATNEYQVTEELIGVQACLKKQNIFLLRVSKHGREVGMSREGRRLLAAWGGENRKLNLRVLFKCESLNKECFSKKTTAWMPLMVSNVHFQTFLGLHREGAGCRANGGKWTQHHRDGWEIIFVFTRSTQDLQIKSPQMCLSGRSSEEPCSKGPRCIPARFFWDMVFGLG